MKKSNVIILENVVSKAYCNKDKGETLKNIAGKLLSEYGQDDYVRGMANKVLEIANTLDESFSFTHSAVGFVVKDEGISDV